jgi:Methyltransferase FkbM domain
MLQCIPITTLMLALNVTHVDYFSLDVEGNEMDVLRTIDFDTFDITVQASTARNEYT